MQYPALVDIVQLDVTDETAIQHAAQHVQDAHAAKLDLLINSSGILSPTGRGETSLRDVTFNVSLCAPVMLYSIGR